MMPQLRVYPFNLLKNGIAHVCNKLGILIFSVYALVSCTELSADIHFATAGAV